MGVTLNPRRVDPLDRILFNTYWLADHFLGKSRSDDVVGKSRSALAERMLRKFEGQEKGMIRPIGRVRKIERGEFIGEFIKKGIPVVLEGFARDLDCTSKWTPEFFASEFGDYEDKGTQ